MTFWQIYRYRFAFIGLLTPAACWPTEGQEGQEGLEAQEGLGSNKGLEDQEGQ